MKLPGLIIALGLILTPMPGTKGENWDINVTKHIYATRGSNVTIRCSFSFPPRLNTGKVRVYWKRTTDTFVYHANESHVLEMYRGKTHLIGNKDRGNCSLMIQNIREEDRNIYLRISVNGTAFSFSKDPVSIFLSVASQEWTITIACVATLVPLALLAIFVAGGIFCRLKCKRTAAVTRDDSRHYANVSRTLSNQAKREETSREQENKMFSEVPETNEPIYINMEAYPEQMSPTTAYTESIYENVEDHMLAGRYS